MTMTYNRETVPVDAQDDPEARDLLRRAFEKTARWPADFKGVTADLAVNVDGKEIKGTVTIKSAQDVAVSLPDAEIQKWATGTISMIAVHRGPRTFDQSDGKSILTLDRGAPHPMGQTIHIHDNLKSHYRVKDDRITQINRTMGPMRFTINVEDSAITADNKYLTTRYTVYYFNPQDGRLLNVESFTDSHVRLGQADLPASRRIISAENGTVSVKTLTFSNHRLL
ncbi:MAG TPA: DUF3386 family protein [Nitrospirales bacterium]